MNQSLRSRFLLLGSLAAMWAATTLAQAHFLWVKAAPADGQKQAQLFFGENLDDTAYHLPESLMKTALWQRTPDGKRVKLDTKFVETDELTGLVAPLAGDGPSVLETVEQYGVYESWLLTYYAKFIDCTSNAELAEIGPSAELKFDIVPKATANGVELTVLWDGKPREGVDATIAVGDGEPINKKSDKEGKITLEPASGGVISVLANFRDETISGDLDGEKYTSAAQFMTLSFPWQGAKQAAAKPQAKVEAAQASASSDRLPPLPDGVASFGGAVADGWLYVYGGHTGTEHDHSAANISKHFRRIQLDGGKAWEELPMQTPLQGLPLVAHDGKLYRVGGLSARNATTDEEEDLHSTTEFASFDPATGKWTALAPLPVPRSSHDAVVIGGKLYVVGGWTLSGTSEGEWIERSLVYDFAKPDAGWQELPEQTFQRRALAAAEWNVKLAALGGMDENADISQSVNFFDPATGKWSQGPDLPGKGMSGFGVSAWNLDGKLYVSGFQGVVLRLNEAGSAWEEVAKLETPRFFHRLLPGGDDELVIVGGASRKGHLTDLEWVELDGQKAVQNGLGDSRATGSASDSRKGNKALAKPVAPGDEEEDRQSATGPPDTSPPGEVKFAAHDLRMAAARRAEARLAAAKLVEQPCPGHIWPAFRGQGNSLTRAANLPITWGDEQNIAWSADLPGYGQSSPVVWRDAVFVTTIQGDNKQTPTVLCFDLATGKLRWQREFKSSQETPASNYVTRSSPTPVVEAERLVVFFESGNFIALDHAGNTLWQRSLVDEYGAFEGKHGVGSSLAATYDAVIVLVNQEGPSYLMAVDKKTGANRWKVDYDPRVAWSSPVVMNHGGQESIVVSAAGRVDAYDAATGHELWSIEGLSGNNVPSATVIGNRVFIGSQDVGSNLALDADGKAANIAWKSDELTTNFSSPLYHDGRLYVVNRSGVAFCADAQSGNILWKHRLGDTCWASPLAATDRIYFFSKDGHAVVLEAGPEWKPLAENDLTIDGETRIYGVAAVDGALVLRTGTRLICLGTPGAS